MKTNEIIEDVWYVDEMSDKQDGEGFDGEFGVFHIDTGFCKNYFCTIESAQEYADELNKMYRK